MEKLEEKRLKRTETRNFTIKVDFFCVKTNKPEEFVDELEQLCKKYCHQNNFFFKYGIED